MKNIQTLNTDAVDVQQLELWLTSGGDIPVGAMPVCHFPYGE